MAHELGTVVYTADGRVLRQLEGKERAVRHIREWDKMIPGSEGEVGELRGMTIPTTFELNLLL